MNSSRMRDGYCLGNPPHAAQPGEDICRICGTLIHDVFLGTYQVKQLLGSGRSGLAYLAVQRRQQQQVTVKLFPPDPASQELWEEAHREVVRVAMLHHSSILPVLSCAPWYPKTQPRVSSLEDEITVTLGKKRYLLTTRPYAPFTLTDLLVVGTGGAKLVEPQPAWRLMRLLGQAAHALSAAHAQGIVHGALVPGNFLLNAQLDHLWVADFGIARLHPPPTPYLPPELSTIGAACWQSANMTAYWRAVTAEGDQFVFALLCYHLFTRAAEVSTLTLQRIMLVIQRATDANPARRFRDINTFVDALASSLAPDLPSPGEASIDSRSQGTTFPFLPAGALSTDQGYRHKTPALPEQENRGKNAASAPPQLPPPPTRIKADQLEQSAGIAFATHDYEAAEQAYQQALQLDGRSASAWLGLGDTYFALERYTEALSAYGQALSLDPNNPEAWFNRATVLDVLGRSDQAALDYERAEQLRSEAARNPGFQG